MKLKLKVLLISLFVTVILGSFATVFIEYSMSVNAKKEIELAAKEAAAELEKQKALEDEEKYKEEMKIAALNDYDKVEDYYHGLALVRRDDKYGYIDKNGNEIISLQYDVANNFTNKNYAKVKKDGKWGYIDSKGKELIPIEYAYCGEVVEDIVAVGNGGKYGFISIAGAQICELMYDKVEAFDPNNKLAKVILNQNFGYIDKTGKVIVPITTPYVDSNLDFSGEWKETEVHSSKAGNVRITGQTSTSFNFEILSKYFTKSGNITGTAEIVKSNVAEYKYNTGNMADTLTFTIIDEQLIISAKNDGSCELDEELTVIGTYTLEAPKYSNDNVITKLFGGNTELFDRIKNALGEDVYSEYFIYGFENGEYKISELNNTPSVVKGILYTVTIPTMEKDFNLLINEDNIYFFAKHKEIYKTDDETRSTIGKMPSIIMFDEL